MIQVTSTYFDFSRGYSSPSTTAAHLIFVDLLQEQNWLNGLNDKSIILKKYANNVWMFTVIVIAVINIIILISDQSQMYLTHGQGSVTNIY